jgi:hypothetical protein
MAMAIPIWDHQFFKYVVRESFNRADAVASTAGTVILLIIARQVGIEGSKVLSADESVRTIETALIAFSAIWVVILTGRACWWPFYWRLESHGGLGSFLRLRLGDYMWPIVLIAGGFFAFMLLSGIGVIWLSLQAITGTSMLGKTNEVRATRRAAAGVSSKNSKANRIETMKGPAESGEICSVEVKEK